jgi:hypothetical protein
MFGNGSLRDAKYNAEVNWYSVAAANNAPYEDFPRRMITGRRIMLRVSYLEKFEIISRPKP